MVRKQEKKNHCYRYRGKFPETLCTKYGYTFLEFPLNVGGRYTAMTNVGLLPMAVAGIDIRELVKGARDMQIRVHEESTEKEYCISVCMS